MVNTLDFFKQQIISGHRNKKKQTKKKVMMLGAMALLPEIRSEFILQAVSKAGPLGFYSSFFCLGIHRLGLYLDSVLSKQFFA